jgi:predicted nucleic acid-binding protein
MPRAVSDSSVLIHLGAIGRLDLLPAAFSEVIVPIEVWREVVEQGGSRAAVEVVRAAAKGGWLRVQSPTNPALMKVLLQNLHPGEAASICLAVEIRPDVLLMDETDGRSIARNLELKTRGIVGLLLEAKQAGRLPLVRPLLTQLSNGGFYLDPGFVARIIAQAGE